MVALYYTQVDVGRTETVPKVFSRLTTMQSLIVAFFCVTALRSVVTLYTYTCFPNNTISIAGLPTNVTALYYHAVQSDGRNCTTTGDYAAGTAEVNGCVKNLPIYFTYSWFNYTFANQIQGGKDVEILNITCYEISATGVAAYISNTLAASILFGDEKGLNVTYDVTSALNVSSANVGDPVKWTIYLPMNYTLQISSCSAYPGTDDSSSHSVLLITDWCSDEDDLITDFDTNSLNTEASAVIQAFKFFNVDNVFLECDLKVCPTQTSCIDSCQSRKKRALISRDDPDAYRTKVSRVLYITLPATSSAVQWPGAGLLLTPILSAIVTVMRYF